MQQDNYFAAFPLICDIMKRNVLDETPVAVSDLLKVILSPEFVSVCPQSITPQQMNLLKSSSEDAPVCVRGFFGIHGAAHCKTCQDFISSLFDSFNAMVQVYSPGFDATHVVKKPVGDNKAPDCKFGNDCAIFRCSYAHSSDFVARKGCKDRDECKRPGCKFSHSYKFVPVALIEKSKKPYIPREKSQETKTYDKKPYVPREKSQETKPRKNERESKPRDFKKKEFQGPRVPYVKRYETERKPNTRPERRQAPLNIRSVEVSAPSGNPIWSDLANE